MRDDWVEEYPTLSHTTYLNSCASGLPSRVVQRRVAEWVQAWEDAPDWGRWVEDVERARRAFARLVGAHADEVAVQQSVSTGVSSLASALRPDGSRDGVVSADVDFPTAPAVWHAQRRRGFRPRLLRALPGLLDERDVEKAVNATTRVLSLPHVASFTGQKLDAPRLVRHAHDAGALVVVDAFQSLGTTPIDVGRWDVDVLVAGAYKWLCGTSGIAFMYVRRDLHAELEPTSLGWFAHDDPYAFDPEAALAPDARRFQFGGPSVMSAVAAEAGIERLLDLDVAAIERHNQGLGDRLLDAADERGWHAFTPRERERRGSIVTLAGMDVERGRRALAEARVTVNERLGGFRVSPHYYNGSRDVDRFLDVVG